MQDVVDRRVGKRGNGREAVHEALVVGDDGGHLCLLQHDFRDPYAVRGPVVLPGQVMATVGRVPREERRGDR